MKEGYNCNIDFMTGKEDCPSGSLFGNLMSRQQVVNFLQDIPVDKKVLRFPGGTNSRSYVYEEEEVDAFISFCQDARVYSITFVVNINNIGGSYLACNRIHAAGVNIEAIEIGNEEVDHQEPKNFWETLRLIFDKRGFYRDKGRAYAQKFNRAKNIFKETFPDVPYCASVQLLTDAKNIGWWLGAKNCDTRKLVIHFYRHPSSDNFIEFLDFFLGKFPTYDLYFTEVNIKYQPGNWQHLAYGTVHHVYLLDYMNYLRNHPQVKLAQVHSLWGHHLFCRYVKEGTRVIDKYHNWY